MVTLGDTEQGRGRPEDQRKPGRRVAGSNPLAARYSTACTRAGIAAIVTAAVSFAMAGRNPQSRACLLRTNSFLHGAERQFSHIVQAWQGGIPKQPARGRQMSILIERLNARERRGSKPRCHLLTHGSSDVVAARLTSLAAPFASVAPTDRWMPDGFENTAECQLDKAPQLLSDALCVRLAKWWLPTNAQGARTPNFDIASTCKIGGARGLLLIEAKAHAMELVNEIGGRQLKEDASAQRKASHITIGAAIDSAGIGLGAATRLSWKISRDSHYQMSNRFAWAWKLTELGMPVVLIYLGFIRAYDMSKPGEVPFADAGAWESATTSHSGPLFPTEVWGRRWLVNGLPLIPLIRSLDLPCSAGSDTRL